ncbi:hypothetical protein P154DRAFT_440339 [Amniculicola lignicola CBS 123094]|uniref:Uncharacterized protein n=1 Tax=Amniculicola lignicola CBS 123094 TaxID=1392246 RepID=A0A6A5W854_9PLEO|nr:hypothetical protein P154DRAFT_440339 [Amniculicola lignicola CBS 123094]
MSKGFLPRPNSLFAIHYSPKYRSWSGNAPPIVRDRVEERPQICLRLDFTTGLSTAKKSTVRNWVKRRLRNAVFEELRLRGIEKDGRLLSTGLCAQRQDALGMALREGKRDVYLKGTLRLYSTKEMVGAEYGVVREHTGKIVDALVNNLSMTLGGKKPGNTSRGKGRKPS